MTPPPATTWHWMGMEGDWGYPMSLDGHIFRTAEIAPLLEHLDYRNPNVLEAALARRPLTLPKAPASTWPGSSTCPTTASRTPPLTATAAARRRWFTPALLAGRPP